MVLTLRHSSRSSPKELATPFTRCRSFRDVPPRLASRGDNLVGHALGMPSSVPRSTRAIQISGWHRRRETSVCRRHRIDLFESACIAPLTSCGCATQTSYRCLGHPRFSMARSVSEGKLSNGSYAEAQQQIFTKRSRHALHSLLLVQGRATRINL